MVEVRNTVTSESDEPAVLRHQMPAVCPPRAVKSYPQNQNTAKEKRATMMNDTKIYGSSNLAQSTTVRTSTTHYITHHSQTISKGCPRVDI
jgi:hypothetical protein